MGRKHINKRVLTIAGIIGVLVLAAGLGVVASFFQQKNLKAPEATVVGQLEDKLPANIKEAQELAVSGKTQEANKKIAEGLADPNLGTQEKYDLLVQQGVTYEIEGKYQLAVNSYLKAEEVKPGFKISKLIADEALLANNKAVALTYYKKGLSQLDKNYPLYESEKKQFEQKIKELGG